MKLVDGIPRRCRIDLMTPAELAIRNAVLAVEESGCDPLLTDAVVLLQQAKEKVADFIEKLTDLPALRKRLAEGVMDWQMEGIAWYVRNGDRADYWVSCPILEPWMIPWEPDQRIEQAMMVAEKIGTLELIQEGPAGASRWAAKFRGEPWKIDKTSALAISLAADAWLRQGGGK